MEGMTPALRADAERSTARILAAAEEVLAQDPQASLGRIADAAGLARATVHRRFTTRDALLVALADQLNARYLQALVEAEIDSGTPRHALDRLAHSVFALKLGNRFAIALEGTPDAEVLAGLDALFERLRGAGDITASDPAWCRGVCLALLDEAWRLPTSSPDLTTDDEVSARTALFVPALLGALGGRP
jgi:AcrR family transcriptional regulator